MGFNPRSHAGSDPASVSFVASSSCFNPRSHAGSDAKEKLLDAIMNGVSIHAPTQGATLQRYKMPAPLPVSIHAPTQGATGEKVNYMTFNKFQSTLPRRERRCNTKMCDSSY